MRVTDFNKDLNTSRANTRHSVVARALREAFPRLLATHEAHPRCTPMETITKGRDGKPRASMAVAVPADVLQRAIDAAKGEV